MSTPFQPSAGHAEGLDDATLTMPLAQAEQSGEPARMLTVLWHPELSRMGDQAVLPAVGKSLSINRFEPQFGSLLGGARLPLGHAAVSRAPVHVEVLPGGSLRLVAPDARSQAVLNGVPLQGEAVLTAAELAQGALLQLGGRVLLWLHLADLLPTTADDALLGVSGAMERLRRQVQLVAATPLPVLVLGETGTGKELVAQALHRLSPRHRGPMVAVNMAALNEGLAVAELFGSQRGSFTGANVTRRGLWAEAEHGTLFLDEVGDTPAVVQPMLLRAIETGEYRPLGADRPVRADVRLVAATDRLLDADRFNQPLLRRLESFVVRTPPLRQRREDLGVLIRHALQQAGSPTDWVGQVPPALLQALGLYDWPGNVRQLGHAVRRLALGAPSGLWPTVEELLGSGASVRPSAAQMGAAGGAGVTPSAAGMAPTSAPASVPPWAAPRRVHRSTAGITPEALLDALDRHGWQLKDAADFLGVSRPSIYNLIERHPEIRRADTLTLEDLQPHLADPTLNLSQLASRLRTPREALRRRLRSLGLNALPGPAEEGDDGDTA